MAIRENGRSSFDHMEGYGSPFKSASGFDAARLGLSLSRSNSEWLRYPDNPAAQAALPALFIDGITDSRAEQFLCHADEPRDRGGAAGPATDTARRQAHDTIVRNAERLVSDLNCSNTLGHAPRAVAESTLRVLSLGIWGGTGISQHSNWQQDVEARRAVIGPARNEDGTIAIGPTQWANCFRDVQERQDGLSRKWSNCAEQAASLAHVISEMMINNPDNREMAGLQVRQAYQGRHSWVEVRYPNGQIIVYDPWARLTGRREDMPARYRDSASTTAWYGRRRD